MEINNIRNIDDYNGFEQGPIRPPSESNSLLIRITRNCPWNQCTFCPVYKGKKFSIRPVSHVLKDIDTIKFYTEKIEQNIKLGKKDNFENINFSPSNTNDKTINAFYAAYNFVHNGMKSIFLQDGNSLILKPKKIIKILNHITQAFPKINRITSYARSKTIAKISNQDLGLIAEAGLNRIHIGMESGSDNVLKLVKKGVDKVTQIKAGQKVKRAGIQLSEYYMPGLGGKKFSKENALETADALNQINPDYIRLRTLAIRCHTPIAEQFKNNQFHKLGEIAVVAEILLFLKTLNNVNSRIKSDHILNLFTEIDGLLPQDKEQMIAPLKKFMNMNREEQMVFCIGRRTNILFSLNDLNNSEKYKKALQLCYKLGVNSENMDEVIQSIIQRFI